MFDVSIAKNYKLCVSDKIYAAVCLWCIVSRKLDASEDSPVLSQWKTAFRVIRNCDWPILGNCVETLGIFLFPWVSI